MYFALGLVDCGVAEGGGCWMGVAVMAVFDTKINASKCFWEMQSYLLLLLLNSFFVYITEIWIKCFLFCMQ